MSEQALDLRRSAQIVRRHKIVVAVFAALGLLAGIGWALHRPPMLSSETQVIVELPANDQSSGAALAGSTNINPALGTEIQIAGSTSVEP